MGKRRCSAKAERHCTSREKVEDEGGHEVRDIHPTSLVVWQNTPFLFPLWGVGLESGHEAGVRKLCLDPTDVGGGARRLGLGTNSPRSDIERATERLDASNETRLCVSPKPERDTVVGLLVIVYKAPELVFHVVGPRTCGLLDAKALHAGKVHDHHVHACQVVDSALDTRTAPMERGEGGGRDG